MLVMFDMFSSSRQYVPIYAVKPIGVDAKSGNVPGSQN